MILTCPECASRYVVDGTRIGAQGRTVRCASCSATWRAMPAAAEPPMDLEPAPAPAPAETPVPEAAERPAAAALPKKIRAERQAMQQTRKAVAAGAVWGVMGAFLLSILGAAGMFRVDVVRLWPRTAGAYAAVGLTVNPTGLAPENVKASSGLKNGHAAVLVTGLIRNVETRAHDMAPLRITLLDKAGKPLVTEIASFPGEPLQPGQTRPFDIAFLDPPAASVGVEVEFALEATGAAHVVKAAHPTPAPPKLRGPHDPELPPLPVAKAVEALPADSPYALPVAAHGQGLGEHPEPTAH